MRSNFTVVWGHARNNTLQETIEVAFVAANCLVLLVTLHVGIVANLFVAWAVYHQKSLQTSTNALLVNLAVIDVLRCAIDCPLLLSIVLSARDARDLGLVFCSSQIASFSLICCVQLFTLACISAERYQAIAHPFKSTERRKRITAWIPLTWLLPISITVICVIFAKDSPVYVKCRGMRMETVDSYDTFGFYILTPVWCVCLTVIIGFYGRIFLLVRAHARKIFDKGSFPPPDKKQKETKATFKSDTENIQTINTEHLKPEKPVCGDLTEELSATTATHSLNVTETIREKTLNDELPCEERKVLEDVVEPNDHQDTKLTNEDQHTDDVSEGSTNGEGAVKPNVCRDLDQESSQSSVNGESGEEGPKTHRDATLENSTNEEDGTSESSASQDITSETSPTAGREEEQTAQETSAGEDAPPQQQQEEEEVAGAVCMMPSLAQRERGNAKKESKLAKRSGYIIFTFLVFWIPLIATVVANHFYYRNGNLTVGVFRELEILTVSVVCLTSLSNPIIYAAVNPQFRSEFHNLKAKWKAFFTRS